MISNDKILVKGLHSAYVEPLNCVLPNSFSIQYEQNSNYQASFTAYNDRSIAFNLLTVESSIFWDNQEYIIKQITPDYSNGAETLQVTATHVAYEVQRVMQHEKKTGTLTYTVQDVLKFVLGGNSLGFTWEVIGNFEKEQITDLGNLNGKDMLSKITETWQDAIFYPDNKKIRIYKHDKLAKNYGNRIDYLHNTSSIKLSYESTNIVNQVKVFGKQKEQEGSSNDKIEYYFEPFIVENKDSIKKWGLHPGADVSDERFTDKEAMRTYALGQLQPEPTFTIDATEQTNEIPKVCEIRRLEVKPSGFVTTVEIVSFTYHPLDNSQATQITLNNKANTILNYQSASKKSLDEAIKAQRKAIKKAEDRAIQAYKARLVGIRVEQEETKPNELLRDAKDDKEDVKNLPLYALSVPEDNPEFGLKKGDKFTVQTDVAGVLGLDEEIRRNQVTYSPATEFSDGLLTANDKSKLDSLQEATELSPGLMSPTDKAKLDSIPVEPVNSIKITDSVTGALYELTIANGEINLTEVQ